MMTSSAKPLSARARVNVETLHVASTAMLINSDTKLPLSEKIFEVDFWRENYSAQATDTGRGAAWFVNYDNEVFVLRHFQRGGAMQRLLGDNYLYTGEKRTRSFAEFDLLHRLWTHGLPVPEPVGARITRHGVVYKADLLSRRIPHAQSWSSRLQETLADTDLWKKIGKTIATFHLQGACHADLNTHNILLDSDRTVYLIDFDKGSVKPTTNGSWRLRNLARLKRSVQKLLAGVVTTEEWTPRWVALQDAYQQEFSRCND